MAEAKENRENAMQKEERASKRKLTVVLPSVMSRVRKAAKKLNDASNLMERRPTFDRSDELMNECDKRRTTADVTDVGPQKTDLKTGMSRKKAGKKDATEARPNVGRSNNVEAKAGDVVNPVGINVKVTKVKDAREKKSKEERQDEEREAAGRVVTAVAAEQAVVFPPTTSVVPDDVDDAPMQLEELLCSPTTVKPMSGTSNQEAVDSDQCLTLISRFQSLQGGSRDHHLYCLQYESDIIAYMLTLEQKYKVVLVEGVFPPFYPHTNNLCKRAMLVDWLIIAAGHFNLLEDTVHLSVTMIDIYLSGNHVPLDRLQLLGITSLFVSSKYEERFPPPIRHLIQLTHNSFTYEEVLKMEIDLLSKLNFQVAIPTPPAFLSYYIHKLERNNSEKQLIEMTAHYLLNLALTDATFSSFLSSVKASSALFLSHHLHAAQPAAVSASSFQLHLPCHSLPPISESSREQESDEWNTGFLHVTGYTLKDIGDCVVVILTNLQEQPRSWFQEAYKKFELQEHLHVSHHPALSFSSALLSQITAYLDQPSDA